MLVRECLREPVGFLRAPVFLGVLEAISLTTCICVSLVCVNAVLEFVLSSPVVSVILPVAANSRILCLIL